MLPREFELSPGEGEGGGGHMHGESGNILYRNGVEQSAQGMVAMIAQVDLPFFIYMKKFQKQLSNFMCL